MSSSAGGEKKVIEMNRSNLENFYNGQDDFSDAQGQDLSMDEDIVMEQILENINSTPIGQVLKRIASLPEVSREKVLNMRELLTNGHYDVTNRLDVALDKVLEDLTA
jgi:hypothetical protein